MTANIVTGTTPVGLRYAATTEYRVVAYAMGGYARFRWTPTMWCLFPTDEQMPLETERALCAALGIECAR